VSSVSAIAVPVCASHRHHGCLGSWAIGIQNANALRVLVSIPVDCEDIQIILKRAWRIEHLSIHQQLRPRLYIVATNEC
jgi:hypothetical protein